MKKVLLISEYLVHYRIAMFESLCDEINLTIAHSSDLSISDLKFSQHKITFKFIGPFLIYKNLPNLNDYDIVVFELKLSSIPLYVNLLKKRNYKLFVFGIGVSASYKKHYDYEIKLNSLRKNVLKLADGIIFYDRYPFTKWIARNINPEKISISYNTVPPDNEFKIEEKTFENFLFIGTLYKQKKIFDLLIAFKIAVNNYGNNIPNLEIIGDGEEYANILNWIKEEGLTDKVILHGKITEVEVLRPIFSRSIACISPGQAGLSVQKCFSYGVPFITSYNAITGGEISSILDGVTGFFYNNTIEGLVDIFEKIITKKVDVNEMSSKCYLFYKNFRSVDIWKKGFLKNIIE